MTIRKKFQNYVSIPTPIARGFVTSTGSGSIFVSSPTGVREFKVENPSNYKVGDTVRFQGRVFLGKTSSESESTVVVV